MNKLFSSGTKMVWRRLAIALGSLTIPAEIILAVSVWRSLPLQHNGWSDSVYPLLFALIGLLTLVAGLTYKPTPAGDVGQRASRIPKIDKENLSDSPTHDNVQNEPYVTTLTGKAARGYNLPDKEDGGQGVFNKQPGRYGSIGIYGKKAKTALYVPGIKTFTCYTVPKEGSAPERSQDKFCHNIKTTPARYSYAVADGVGSSFLPSSWAEIVTQRFVDLPEDFTTPSKFEKWLAACRNEWDNWVVSTWIPEANRSRGMVYDWSSDRARGAETTLIGCSYSHTALMQAGHTNIRVTAIGDSVFFLVRPPSNQHPFWQHWTHAIVDPEEFGPVPYTLDTVSKDIEKMWSQVKQEILPAYPGDYVFLTTDALAKWILTQLAQENIPWEALLSLIDYDTFLEFVREERFQGTLDLDDTTMMVVPLGELY